MGKSTVYNLDSYDMRLSEIQKYFPNVPACHFLVINNEDDFPSFKIADSLENEDDTKNSLEKNDAENSPGKTDKPGKTNKKRKFISLETLYQIARYSHPEISHENLIVVVWRAKMNDPFSVCPIH